MFGIITLIVAAIGLVLAINYLGHRSMTKAQMFGWSVGVAAFFVLVEYLRGNLSW